MNVILGMPPFYVLEYQPHTRLRQVCSGILSGRLSCSFFCFSLEDDYVEIEQNCPTLKNTIWI